MNTFKFKLAFLFAVVFSVSMNEAKAQDYGPYNQAFTMNQQYGSTNWYSSPLGMGVAQAGVTLIGGLVNALSRPDPVVVQQQQPVYVNGNGGYQGYPQQGNYPQQVGYPQGGYPQYGYGNPQRPYSLEATPEQTYYPH